MADGSPPLRRPWSRSDRLLPRAFVRPAQRLMAAEAAGGIAMLVAAVAALVWANSPLRESYETLWETRLVVELGDLLHLDHLSLRDWVNDALMALFFLLVGLEIKRELVVGELRDPRAAALPALAAVGGMAVPALIYVAFNAGGEGADGWGIPMATDIAFAVGVVSLLGRRVPLGAKLFLLTLAVVDDLGAILVIAAFYTEELAVGWLLAAVAAVVLAAAFRRAEVVSLVPYGVLAVACWVSLLESGVHATLAGVAFGLLTPARPFQDPRHFGPHARRLVGEHDRFLGGGVTDQEMAHNDAVLREVAALAVHSESPLDRLEHGITRWVAFGVVPVFALANAGVRFSGDAVGGALGDPVVLGVGLGLLLGKTVGVFGASWLAVALGLGRLPRHTGWRHMLGLAVTAGIGFTVALFVTTLAFADPALTASAKIGILGASAIAGVIGYSLLRTCPPVPAEDQPEPVIAPAAASSPVA